MVLAASPHDDPDRDSVNEKTVRPLDAEGALAYSGGRRDVDGARIVLQGWSNGGSTALNTMIRQGYARRLPRRARLLSWLRRAKRCWRRRCATSVPIVMLLGSKRPRGLSR